MIPTTDVQREWDTVTDDVNRVMTPGTPSVTPRGQTPAPLHCFECWDLIPEGESSLVYWCDIPEKEWDVDELPDFGDRTPFGLRLEHPHWIKQTGRWNEARGTNLLPWCRDVDSWCDSEPSYRWGWVAPICEPCMALKIEVAEANVAAAGKTYERDGRHYWTDEARALQSLRKMTRCSPFVCSSCARAHIGLWRISSAGIHRHAWCCPPCLPAIRAREKSDRRKALRARARSDIRCTVCEEPFTPTRSDARYCSPACRQYAYRQRQGAR